MREIDRINRIYDGRFKNDRKREHNRERDHESDHERGRERLGGLEMYQIFRSFTCGKAMQVNRQLISI